MDKKQAKSLLFKNIAFSILGIILVINYIGIFRVEKI